MIDDIGPLWVFLAFHEVARLSAVVIDIEEYKLIMSKGQKPSLVINKGARLPPPKLSRAPTTHPAQENTHVRIFRPETFFKHPYIQLIKSKNQYFQSIYIWF